MAIPNLIHVLFITMIFFVVFAIFGVNFLKEKFQYCLSDAIQDLNGFEDNIIDTKYDCLNFGGEWRHYDSEFSHIGTGLITIF